MSRKGYRKPGTCPRCGAIPSHQRHQLRVGPPSFGEYERISDLNPVDAVQCPRCKEVFQVSTFEHDEDFVVGAGRDFFECVPSYCPICGEKIEYEQ